MFAEQELVNNFSYFGKDLKQVLIEDNKDNKEYLKNRREALTMTGSTFRVQQTLQEEQLTYATSLKMDDKMHYRFTGRPEINSSPGESASHIGKRLHR